MRAIDHLVDDTRSALHWFADLTGISAEEFHDVGGFAGNPRGDSFYTAGAIAFSLIQASDLHHEWFLSDRVTKMYPKMIAAHGVTRHAVLILCDTPEELEVAVQVKDSFQNETYILWVNDDETVMLHG